MNKPNQLFSHKSAQRPTTSLARHNQVTTRRDFQLRQSKNFSLQADTVIEFVDGGAFADLNAVHCAALSLHLSSRQLQRSAQPACLAVLQSDDAFHHLYQAAAYDDAQLVKVGF